MDTDLLHDPVRDALKAGAGAAEAVGSERGALSVGVRLGELEEVEREESAAISACASWSASARRWWPAPTSRRPPAPAWSSAPWPWPALAPEDPYAGLAPQDRLARGPMPRPRPLRSRAPARPSSWKPPPARPRAPPAPSPGASATAKAASASWSEGAGGCVDQRRLRRRATSGSGFTPVGLGHRRRRLRAWSAARTGARRAGAVRPADAPSSIGLRRRPARGARGSAPRKIDSTTAAVIFDNRGLRASC